MSKTRDHVRAAMQSKFGHTDGAQGQHGAGTIGRSGGSGGGTTMLGAGYAMPGKKAPMSGEFADATAGAGTLGRHGGTGGGMVIAGAGDHQKSPTKSGAYFGGGSIKEVTNVNPGAGGGTPHRSGGTGDPGAGTPDPGGFKGGKSALAGTGGHKLSKAMDEHVDVGNPNHEGTIADKYSQQMDIDDVGDNRAHVNGGRDRAMQVSRDTGGMHPMEHAGKMGKGRW